VGEQLEAIKTSVDRTSEIVVVIAAAAREQVAAIDQVSRAVSQVGQVTQQNAANSEESSSAAAELSGQSEELAAMVGTFKIEQGTVVPRIVQDAPRPTLKKLLSGHGKPRSPIRLNVEEDRSLSSGDRQLTGGVISLLARKEGGHGAVVAESGV
jgi:hypothetical protein